MNYRTVTNAKKGPLRTPEATITHHQGQLALRLTFSLHQEKRLENDMMVSTLVFHPQRCAVMPSKCNGTKNNKSHHHGVGAV